MKKQEQKTTAIADALADLLKQVSDDACEHNQLAKISASLKALTNAVSALCKTQHETRIRVEETRDGLAAYNSIIQQIHNTQKRYAVWNAVAQERQACAAICDALASNAAEMACLDAAGAASKCAASILMRGSG